MVDYDTIQELEENTNFSLSEFKKAFAEDIESVRSVLESALSDIEDIEYTLDGIDEDSDAYEVESVYDDYETALAYTGLEPSPDLEEIYKNLY